MLSDPICRGERAGSVPHQLQHRVRRPHTLAGKTAELALVGAGELAQGHEARELPDSFLPGAVDELAGELSYLLVAKVSMP